MWCIEFKFMILGVATGMPKCEIINIREKSLKNTHNPIGGVWAGT